MGARDPSDSEPPGKTRQPSARALRGAGERIGAVVIGRNEGARLREALRSAGRLAAAVVYVDSGSKDDSVAIAREEGCAVVELDPGTPFTAARARNAGFSRLLELAPSLEYVQFIDGDCVLAPGWLEKAAAFLDDHPDVAVVCGLRREERPEDTVYNWITDIEWQAPCGEVHACGGDAMIRVPALRGVSGYRPGMIAGEEPELCLRLRRAGYRIWRLQASMTSHDARIDRFAPWWRRQLRSGHAYAELAHLQGRSIEPYWLRRIASILLWAGLPVLGLALAPFTSGTSATALALPALLWARLICKPGSLAAPRRSAYATLQVATKFAELCGLALYAWRTLVKGGSTSLIEYERSSTVGR